MNVATQEIFLLHCRISLSENKVMSWFWNFVRNRSVLVCCKVVNRFSTSHARYEKRSRLDISNVTHPNRKMTIK